jgi:hypothetical protein
VDVAYVERRAREMERAKIANDSEGVVRQALTERIFRVSNTLSSDTPGLMATSGDPGAWINGALARRTAPLEAFLAAVTTATITPGAGGKPWVPELPPPLVGGPQAGAEKTELVSVKVVVNGDSVMPTLIACVSNVSAQAYLAAGDTIELLLREATLVATAGYVVAALEAAAGVAVADLPAAVAALEAAGWPPSLLAGPSSALLGEDLERLALAGITVVAAPTSGLLLVSLPGAWIATADTVVRKTEPRIGGYEIGAYTDVVAQVQAGSVAAIGGGVTTTTRRGGKS